ncbi:MAG: ATP-binding cassette domain-containing protein [Sphingomonadales bacterium]
MEATVTNTAPPVENTGILPLALDRVSFSAGGQALIDEISLQLDAGPMTLLLGPNGAGKSLLLRLCHGLVNPTSGSIQWRGPGGAQSNRAQAMVFQRPVMLRRSARGNLIYALAVSGWSRRDRGERVERMLERAGLEDIADRSAWVLSGGEQQRLALARAWIMEPQVLFLDEPTANLDPAATRAVEGMIRAIHEAGTKIVMTTHDLGQARRLADEVMFIYQGAITERAAANTFFAGPTTSEAAAYVEGRLP